MNTTLCRRTTRTRLGSTPRARGPRRGLRLTHRGRLLVTTSVLVLALGMGLFCPWGSSVGASTTKPVEPSTTRITVAPGSTLWQIARTVDPWTDPRITIERIRDLNGLRDSSIRAGQEIVIPVT